MKSEIGKISKEKVDKIFKQVGEELNDCELGLLTDALVWDKKILPKTVQLVLQDIGKKGEVK
jgi:hypothetical protein